MTFTEQSSSRQLKYGDSRIHYHDVGSGEPLLMLQAFGPLPGTTAWLTYHRVIEQFAANYRCILLDYPNFGRSTPVRFDEPVHDLYVRHAVAVLDELEVGATKVLGVSTGGTVALDLALTLPERVTSLVIGGCEASTGGDPYLLSPFPSEVARLFDECQSKPADQDRLRRLLSGFVYDESIVTDDLIETMYAWRMREPEHAEAWSLSRSVPHSNVAALSSVAAPTLIVHGRFDRMVPLEQALRLLTLLPSADVVVLNHCGHWAPVERPAEFCHHALGFLDRR